MAGAGKGWLWGLAGIVCPLLAVAELQRWTDDNGVIYYREIVVQDATAGKAGTKPDVAQPAPRKTRKSRPSAKATSVKAQKAQAKAEARQQRVCEGLRTRLARIERQLGAGYREPEGNELRRQRRELGSRLFHECP